MAVECLILSNRYMGIISLYFTVFQSIYIFKKIKGNVIFPFSVFSEMPCLAEYDDGLWYRAKIVSIKEFNPLVVLVQFVDYGSTEKLTVNRLKNKKVNLN